MFECETSACRVLLSLLLLLLLLLLWLLLLLLLPFGVGVGNGPVTTGVTCVTESIRDVGRTVIDLIKVGHWLAQRRQVTTDSVSHRDSLLFFFFFSRGFAFCSPASFR